MIDNGRQGLTTDYQRTITQNELGMFWVQNVNKYMIHLEGGGLKLFKMLLQHVNELLVSIHTNVLQ